MQIFFRAKHDGYKFMISRAKAVLMPSVFLWFWLFLWFMNECSATKHCDATNYVRY